MSEFTTIVVKINRLVYGKIECQIEVAMLFGQGQLLFSIRTTKIGGE